MITTEGATALFLVIFGFLPLVGRGLALGMALLEGVVVRFAVVFFNGVREDFEAGFCAWLVAPPVADPAFLFGAGEVAFRTVLALVVLVSVVFAAGVFFAGADGLALSVDFFLAGTFFTADAGCLALEVVTFPTWSFPLGEVVLFPTFAFVAVCPLERACRVVFSCEDDFMASAVFSTRLA